MNALNGSGFDTPTSVISLLKLRADTKLSRSRPSQNAKAKHLETNALRCQFADKTPRLLRNSGKNVRACEIGEA